jgi:chromosome partitioning protein
MIDDRTTDWIIVRNRLSTLDSRNRRHLIKGLEALSGQAGFRTAPGISERLILRELFPRGLTALDQLDKKTLGSEPTLSHVAARREIRNLIDTLNLPIANRTKTAAVDGGAARRGSAGKGSSSIAAAGRVASGRLSAT